MGLLVNAVYDSLQALQFRVLDRDVDAHELGPIVGKTRGAEAVRRKRIGQLRLSGRRAA
jgi:hypothetical protein